MEIVAFTFTALSILGGLFLAAFFFTSLCAWLDQGDTDAREFVLGVLSTLVLAGLIAVAVVTSHA